MKTSRVCKTAPVIAILFGSIFHADPASAEGCPTPNFAAARTFDVGAEGRPFCVAIGDFNGDGQLDLVVANYGCPACPSPVSGSVSILLGHGDGAFQSVAKYDAGPNPQAVVVGDFNGDGKPDLAVANNGSTNVAVLLGNGDATFQTAISYGVGGAPPPPYAATGVLAIGDFNRDGKVDLAVANSGGVSVLSGKGDGTFQNAVNYATGGSASSVVVGDFNGDGKPDLAANNGGGVSVLLGNGDGSFQAAVNYGTGGSTSSVVAGDFNGDGKTDLAVATATTPASSDNVSVLLGNGDGTFQAAVHYVVGSFPYSVTAGDFNGDGKADLAVATDVGISLLLGNSDGTFQAAVNYGAGNQPSFVVAGDFNSDGKLDLAVADGLSGTVAVLLGNGDGTFQAGHNVGAGWTPVSVAASDFNSDGKLDLAVGGGDGSVTVLLGSGDGSFTMTPTSYSAGTLPPFVAVGDFNGDDKPDVAVANLGSTNVSVLLGKGDGTFQAAVNFAAGTNPVSVAIGDFNGDGKSDLAVAITGTYPAYTNGGVSVLLGKGDGTFEAAVNYGAGTNPVSVAVGDFNGDGKLDLAVANQGATPVSNQSRGTLSVLLGNGDGTFQAAVNYDAGTGPASVAVGDFNGDGKPDLAVANTGSFTNATSTKDGSVSLLSGKGDGTFQAAVGFGAGISPFSMAVSDFNGDGRLDLAVVSHDGNVSVFSGNGDGTLQAPVNYAAGSQPAFVAAGDFNGDGHPDLAVANSFSQGTVSVLLNTCGGCPAFDFTLPQAFDVGSSPFSVAVGDFNSDGKRDLVVANSGSTNVSVLLGNGDGTFQAALNFSAGPRPYWVASGDFNGDGKPDLAVADSGSTNVSVLLGNGDGTFQTAVNYGTGPVPFFISVSDFNLDGKPVMALSAPPSTMT
ncbi:MAG: VCBS repeat-containing protein [Verrucomicrobia bacterium]|nr:MAG: VCBS repeat-containing protein [Verrucomicrobiota bacterium]